MLSKISAEISCSGSVWSQTGRGDESVKVDLKWSVDLDNDDKNKLKNGLDISKEARVSISQSDSKRILWPVMKGKANESIKVWVLPSADKLEIELGIVGDPRNSGMGAAYKHKSDNKTLKCEHEKLTIRKNGNGGNLYSKGSRWTGRKFVAHNAGQLNVGISLGDCMWLDKEQIKCSLKVVTKWQI